MAVHFIHIPKTGGTGIKTVIREAGRPETPFGPVRVHPHAWTLKRLRDGDYAFFCTRAVVPRFISGFYSRLRKGQPRYFYEWNEVEQEAFARFHTPQELASALADDDPGAITAMEGVQQISIHQHHLVPRGALQRRADQILYIARTETLSAEWPLLKAAVGLPSELELPSDPVARHKNPLDVQPLDDRGKAAIRAWYAKDVRLLKLCEEIRRERGMGLAEKAGPVGALRRGARAGRSLLRSVTGGG